MENANRAKEARRRVKCHHVSCTTHRYVQCCCTTSAREIMNEVPGDNSKLDGEEKGEGEVRGNRTHHDAYDGRERG